MPEQATKKGRTKPRQQGGEDPYGHAKGCAESGKPPQPRAITLGSRATTLRLRVLVPLEIGDGEYLRWGYSLGYALRMGMRHTYMLDGPEVDFVLEPRWRLRQGEAREGIVRAGALTFIDAALGGSGFLERAAEELHLVARRALDHLDHPGCETACYRCLKSYQNQRHHEHLSWPHVLPELEHLASAPPRRLAARTGDRRSSRPWIEAYEAGVGSPLELKFLRLFELHGLQVEKQVPVAANDGEQPISTADFVVRESGGKVAIYIDSAAFHRGERLRRDRLIRRRLHEGSLGWKVVALRSEDLARGARVVEEIRRAAGPVPR
ncbi:MAG: DUF1998 domain-containing protein [Planctomycetes bacterium]|nr:DUF1998 domain-containing protein [Planctomycetota bacterium]